MEQGPDTRSVRERGLEWVYSGRTRIFNYPVEEKGAYVMAEEGEKLVNITVAGIKAETACEYMISDDLEYDFQRKCDEEGNIYYTTAVERDKYSQDAEFYLIDKNDKIKYKIISQED